MPIKTRLSKATTLKQFDNGYWYADEIKKFAKEIGIENSGKLRKDELEKLIKHYLKSGKVKKSDRKNITRKGIKDLEIGLSMLLPVVNYTSNKKTKNFITTEAQKLKPGLKVKSGVWYRLNRWHDERMNRNRKFTYGDLVKQFIRLNESEGNFKRVTVVRYINFLSDYLANEKSATRSKALKAWKKLNTMDIPKDYGSWKKAKRQLN